MGQMKISYSTTTLEAGGAGSGILVMTGGTQHTRTRYFSQIIQLGC